MFLNRTNLGSSRSFPAFEVYKPLINML